MDELTTKEKALIERIRASYPEEQSEMILRAFSLAKKAHEGQLRLSGEPYFIHPCAVAEILLDLGMDAETIAAGFLHDVLEDTDVKREELVDAFGESVTTLVDGVTKIGKMHFKSKEQAQAENFRKMMIAVAKDIRVIIIKFADRLHNMRSLSYKSPEDQIAISQETLDIYSPFADRLGIAQIKGELEDLAMRYLYPKEYYDLVALVDSKKAEREAFVAKVTALLKKNLDPLGISYEINGRAKHFYSIYRKMKRRNCPIDEIYDLLAIRIIIDGTETDCYTVLGTVHAMWTPISGRIKDYIATEKVNGYRSLHTTVTGPIGERPFEIQIRTREMHRIDEFGVASHWKYKDGKTDHTLDAKMTWLREIMDLHENDAQNSEEYLKAMKTEMFNDEVFVYTPNGDVKNLPLGATVVDFAYAIHSDVGNKCVGGKVNARMVPLSTKLNTGDVVEIVTSPNARPSRDWLRFVASSATRARIRQYFKRTMRDENIRIGKDMLVAACKTAGYASKDLMPDEWIAEIAEKQGFPSADDLLVAVGCGEIKTKQIIDKLLHRYQTTMPKEEVKTVAPKKTSSSNGVLIDGEDGMQVHMCKCCNPLPGDRIVGYVTRGRGINVHRADCENVATLEQERLIKAEWSGVAAGKFSATLYVYATSTVAINQVTELFSGMNVELTHIAAAVDKDKNVKIEVTVALTGREELLAVKNKLMQIKTVTDVVRG